MFTVQHKWILNIFDIINKLSTCTYWELFFAACYQLQFSMQSLRQWIVLIYFIIVMSGWRKSPSFFLLRTQAEIALYSHMTETKRERRAVSDFLCQIFQYKTVEKQRKERTRKKFNFNLHGNFFMELFCCHQAFFLLVSHVFPHPWIKLCWSI